MPAESKKKRIISISIIAAVIIILGVVFIFFNPLKKFQSKTIELGSPVDSSVDAYLHFTDGFLKDASLDISQVNNMKVGEYAAEAKALGITFHYKILVEDTTAPEIQAKENIYIGQNQENSTDKFVESVSDLSGTAKLRFSDNSDQNSIKLSELGETSVNVEAYDEAGNVKSIQIKCIVEEVPIFVGVKDNSIKTGSDYIPKENVAAVDKNFGNISESIQENDNGFTTEKEGQFQVEFSVTNPHGITATASQNLTVQQQEQDVLYGLSKEEIRTLLDYNYFLTQPLEEPDRDKTIELVGPSLVSIYCLNCTGNYIYVCGSGIIYAMDEEYMYIVSNHHVLNKYGNVAKDMNIKFYNGYTIAEHAPLEEYYDSELAIDVALIKFPIEEVPLSLLLKLKTTNNNLEYAEALPVGTDLIELAKNHYSANGDIIKDVSLLSWESRSEEFVDFAGKYQSNNNCLVTTRAAVGGMSGTGIFDWRGYLIAQVAHSITIHSTSESNDVSNTLEALQRVYEYAR